MGYAGAAEEAARGATAESVNDWVQEAPDLSRVSSPIIRTVRDRTSLVSLVGPNADPLCVDEFVDYNHIHVMKDPMEVVPQGKKEQTKYGPGFRRARKKAMERSRGIGRSQGRGPADEGGGPLRPCPRYASRRTVESSRSRGNWCTPTARKGAGWP